MSFGFNGKGRNEDKKKQRKKKKACVFGIT